MTYCETVYHELQLAVKHGHSDTVKRLLELRLLRVDDFSTQTLNLGSRLLQTAVKKGYSAIVEELLKHGADANGFDIHGDTVLHLAVKNKLWFIANMLWLAGADPRRTNIKGRTALSMLPADNSLVDRMRGALPPALKDVQLAVSLSEQERSALSEKFCALVSHSNGRQPTVSAQLAVTALQSVLSLHAQHAEAPLEAKADWVVNIVVQHMQRATGRLSADDFFRAYHDLRKVCSATNARAVSNELRTRFQSAADSTAHIHTRIAKALLHEMFQQSGGGSDSSTKNTIAFRRTNDVWNESQVESMLSNGAEDDRAIDEDGFVAVGLAVLLSTGVS